MNFFKTLFKKNSSNIKSSLSSSALNNALDDKPRTTMMVLEPRIMFDGAALDTAIHDVIDVKPPVQDTRVAEDTAKLLQALADFKPPVQTQAADPTQTDGKKEVAFIDTTVSDWQALANGMQKGVEIELIDGN